MFFSDLAEPLLTIKFQIVNAFAIYTEEEQIQTLKHTVVSYLLYKNI